MQPKRLTKLHDRQMARYARDEQWNFMARVIQCGTIWFCPWDKHGFHKREAVNEDFHGLIDGCERLEWLNTHPDWWVIGDWVEKRCARPIMITEAGILAFIDWPLYDQELVTGGLMEPGYIVTPGHKRYKTYTGPCPACGMPRYGHAEHACPAREFVPEKGK